MTLARVSAETLAPSVKVRETAERETPASSATRLALTEGFFPGVSFDFVTTASFSGPQRGPAAVRTQPVVQYCCTAVQGR